MDLQRIRQMLDRHAADTPLPPLVYEPTARLVYSDLGLPELFAHAAARGGLSARLVHVEDLAAAVVADLGALGIRRMSPSAGSTVLRKVRLADGVAALGVGVVDSPGAGTALATGCDGAVAETGSLVFRGGVPPGWHAAPARVVVLEPRNLVPDLIDLLATRPGEQTLVSGPAALRVFVLH